jgi:glucose/arabinose dehydrogenase
VIEHAGKLKRFDSLTGGGKELADLKSPVSFSECGLLGIAVHPNFDGMTEKRIYLSSTPKCDGFMGPATDAVDEYIVEGDKATAGKRIFEVADPQGNHNGGSLAFGPDGFLYYGLGDGGNANDTGTGHATNGNGQTTDVPLAKILRFDVEKPDAPPMGNLTEADVGGAKVDGRVFHYGLRNPWRISFDMETGDLWIGDVGQDNKEEINVVPKGARALNFGWPAREGKGACSTCMGKTLLTGTKETAPIYDYSTKGKPATSSSLGKGSVTGGYVYRGKKIPGMYGRYLFADYVQGFVAALTSDGKGGSCDVVEDLKLDAITVPSFGQDLDGEIYVINMSRNKISRIDPQ